MKKIILFGAGKIGKEALEYFGEEYVYGFCDNAPIYSDRGGEKYGKPIIPFPVYCGAYAEYLLIICASEKNTAEMKEQCEAHGITDYFLFSEIKEYHFLANGTARFIEQYLGKADRVFRQKKAYQERIFWKNRQIEGLVRLMDLPKLAEAEGFFRGLQLKKVAFAKEFLEAVREWDLDFFLIKDCLYGAVVRGGFIPWSDTFQLGIQEPQYNQMLDGCRECFADTRQNVSGIICVPEGERIHVMKRGQTVFDWVHFEVDCVHGDQSGKISLEETKFEGSSFLRPTEAGDYITAVALGGECAGLERLDEWEAQTRKRSVSAEFYLVDAFEISHFEPFYRVLRKMGVYAVFVAESDEDHVVPGWLDYDRAVSILREKELEFKTLANPFAEMAFSTQAIRNLGKYGASTLKLSLQYGCSLLRNAFGASKAACEGFDYKFSNGPFDRRLSSRYMPESRVIDVGYPRYYSFFARHLSAQRLRNEVGIRTGKKIIAYLPTWDEHSSISLFFEQLKQLRREYYIVTRPHHCTYRLAEKKEDMDKLYELSDLVIEPSYDLGRFAMLGDLMLIDAKSGATLESVFLNPDMKMLWLSVCTNLKDYFWDEIDRMVQVVNHTENLKTYVDCFVEADPFLGYRKENIARFFSKKSDEELEKSMGMILANVQR